MKLSYGVAMYVSFVVAPHAGAWIETLIRFLLRAGNKSPPMRGRGLKQPKNLYYSNQLGSPPMRGRGLKLVQDGFQRLVLCRPPCGGVD